MATITFTLSSEHLNTLINAICFLYKYQSIILDENHNFIPNPETKAQFTRRMIIEFMKDGVKSYIVKNDIALAKELALLKPGIDVT